MASSMIFKGKEGFLYVLICFYVFFTHILSANSSAENKTTRTSQACPACCFPGHVQQSHLWTSWYFSFSVSHVKFFILLLPVFQKKTAAALEELVTFPDPDLKYSHNAVTDTSQGTQVAQEVNGSNGFKNDLVNQLLVFFQSAVGVASKSHKNKLSAPSPPWIELCVLGGVLLTWYRRLLSLLLQRLSLSLFEFTVGVIPVSPSKSRSPRPIPFNTKVRNLDEAEPGCRAGWITPHTAEQGSFTARVQCCVMPWLITDAHSTQPSPHRHLQGGKKGTLKRA